MFRFIFPVIVFVVLVGGEINNVCRNLNDYYTVKSNPNCYYNPAVDKSTGEIVQIFGYPFEEHNLVNPEGYTLQLHRIPNTRHSRKMRNPIFLQHGIYTTSTSFVITKNNSLAFQLSDLGYDVWMGNFRGNIYSSKHSTLTVSDPKFWDFGLDDMALEDLPLCINYVTKVTNSTGKIIYIGHSMGTTAALIFASEKHEEAKKLVKFFILMGPTCTLHNMKAPIAKFAHLSNEIYKVTKSFEMITLLSRGDIFNKIYRIICLESPKLMQICSTVAAMIFGPRTSITMEYFPVLVSSLFLGSSIKTAKQEADSIYLPFRKLDLGIEGNKKKYGRSIPPDYDLSKIKVPFHVIAAQNDWLTSYKDAKILYNNYIPQSLKYGFYTVPSLDFNHMDYILGATAKNLVYNHIFSMIQNVTQIDESNNFV